MNYHRNSNLLCKAITTKGNLELKEFIMSAYVYNVESKEIVLVINAETNEKCESIAEDNGYMGCDEYGLSYSNEGLSETKFTDFHNDNETNILVDKIENSTSLTELRNSLNSLAIHIDNTDDEIKLEEYVDLTSLPHFDNDKTEWVDGSFSCDLHSHLIYNDCAGDVAGRVGWEILPVSYFED